MHQPETPMKIIANIAGVLLGLIFNVVALNFFFHFFEMPAPPAEFSPFAMTNWMRCSERNFGTS